MLTEQIEIQQEDVDLSYNPDKCWKEYRKRQHFKTPNCWTCDKNKPIYPDKLRFVCVSDTHSFLHKMKYQIPEGDVLLHAGDFSNKGEKREVVQFNQALGDLPHKFKVVIAGNHELKFDTKWVRGGAEGAVQTQARDDLTNCIYLQDSDVTVCGVQIYGSPWQPEFNGWAFNLPRGQSLLAKWNLIPPDIDILMTHGPPLGRGDLCCNGGRVGCVELLNTIQKRVRPKFHVFGHIHEDYGSSSDGHTTYINACTCNKHYSPVNSPVMFDIDLPPGHTKTEKPVLTQQVQTTIQQTKL